MVHILAPRPAAIELPTFFNLDSVVGAAPAQNQRLDVMFVQFCFKFVASHGKSLPTPELVTAFNNVRVTGVIDTATIAVIRMTQEGFKKSNPQVIVDGRVSPARGYSYGGVLYTIVQYNNILQTRCKPEWPRIDKLPGCPPELGAAVFKAVVGSLLK